MPNSTTLETATQDRRESPDGRAGRAAAALLTALVVVLASLVSATVAAGPAGASSVEDAFTGKLNHERSSRGIPTLTTRSALVEVARAQARRMARSSRLYHNPGLTSDVTNWRWVGENVGYGPDALTVHVAFMNSPGHKANILDRDYTEVGIGAVTAGGRVWVAEVFRRPLRVATASRVASRGSVRTFSRTLRYGSTGTRVKKVQARLHLSRTGYYGTYTRRAVARFQKAQGWHGRGNVGPKTWSRLF